MLYSVASLSAIQWNKSVIYVHKSPSSWISLLIIPPSYPSRSVSQSTNHTSLWYTAGSHYLSILHMVVYIYMYVNPDLLVCPTFPFPYSRVHTAILYVCVSIPALHLCSSVPFSRFHIYALIYDTCFSLSDLLYCTWENSRFIHLTTADSVLFLLVTK